MADDRDHAVFLAAATALGSADLLETLMGFLRDQHPEAFAAFGRTTAARLERRLAEAGAPPEAFSREALFNEATIMQLQILERLGLAR